ncbi:cobaltochelatase subunit CobN [Aquihabitans sp. G128]|uniref:cobaltochelatase subunit CobN n=1 Tax=Aquihabitans sp. G128 TaxID=2849779 RepID=UPI001C21A66F|nr:cobaltochelatase subunit CobN [Aquihabitans sp. G128]QXC59191.1 cobaltochelatase subunit CobN [Aquihabitans sp. G128]
MFLVVTNNDLDLLALRAAVDELPEGFPPVRAHGGVHLDPEGALPELDGVRVVLVRLLKGRAGWERPLGELVERCRAEGIALVATGGEAALDADLAGASTVPAGIVGQAHDYWTRGGPANLAHLLRFLADTILLEGFGFEPPADIPAVGVLGDRAHDPARPTVAVVTYRAGVLAGDTLPIEQLCDAIEARGANARAVWCYSLRAEADGSPPAALALLRDVDVIVTTTWAAGGSVHAGDAVDATATRFADPARTGWDLQGQGPEKSARFVGGAGPDGAAKGWASPLDELGVPVVQTQASTGSVETWAEGDGLSPLDVALGVAIPELDGRIIAGPLSFTEVVDDGGDLGVSVAAHRAVPDRVERLAGQAVRLARLRRTPAAEKKVALVLSAYPTERSRIGNAVALDTPATLVRILASLHGAGYPVAPPVGSIPGRTEAAWPADAPATFDDDGNDVGAPGNALADAVMARLADGLTYDQPTLSPEQQALAAGRLPVEDYTAWFATLPQDLQDLVTESWGPAPGEVTVHDGHLVFAGIDLGGVVVAVQPPRGFGEDPIGTYHDPELAPPHHYLAFYRWLELGFGADAVVHLGKHGTLEWMPGKATGPSGSCVPDAALGDLPFLYPFVVNDPGEATQAKRRTHAVIVDHLPPPMTRAESYDDTARLETLLDAYAQIEALDPGKLPAIQGQVWDLLVTSDLAQDLGVEEMPDPDDFGAMIGHVDGYLCALKDAQIRGGLHVFGEPPVGGLLVDTVLAITRQPQGTVPALRATVAADKGVDVATAGVRELDDVEAECRRLVEGLAAADWAVEAAGDHPTLRWVASTLVPALARTPDELANLLLGLDGGHVPAGPSGAPTRGGAHVLPTGRNLYSVDPRAIPSPLAWDVGVALADRLVERHLAETGRFPRTVGLVVWGTANMRTQGDDVAEALALLGVRPRWHDRSGRVEGLEVIPLADLGRPRVDVTLRISGFFRDAFPDVVSLLDDAVRLVGELDEAEDQNPVRATGLADPRIFGPAPGTYGSGVQQAILTQGWRDRADLGELYLQWSGWAYGRDVHGAPAGEAVRRRFAAIEVAVKNQDNREHDLFDGSDYYEEHGGLVAAVGAASTDGHTPLAWFGDSADPSRPQLRSLAEEAARVVRTRVLNPKWLAAMRRHGYKGASEVAATVDHLFGYDATTGVVADWMYERVTRAYLDDPEMLDFYAASNPWALRSMAERLHEAMDRGLWEDPSAEARATIERAMLAAESFDETR